MDETHYYPYGLAMAGTSTEAPLKLANNYKYNGKELNHDEFSDGTGLDWYSYGMREYDPQIGRFPQLDPLTDEFAALTPYQYASDEPIGNIDLDGLEAAPILNAYQEGSVYVMVATAKPVTAVSVGKAFFKGLGKDLWGAVKGTAHAVVHLDQTVKALWTLADPNPASLDKLRMGMAVYQQGQQIAHTFKTGNANAKAAIIGAGVGELLQLAGGEVGEVGKVGELGKVSELAEDLGKITRDAAKLEEAAKTMEVVETIKYTKSSLKYGRDIHKAYHAGEIGKEFRLPSGGRIDFLDIKNGVIHELKPFNPHSIRRGLKQLKKYKDELTSPATIEKYPEFKNINWKMILDTY